MSTSISPSPKFKVGQAVYCHFPFDDGNHDGKDRLALILKVLTNNNNTYYRIAKLTKTYFEGRYPGLFIRKESREGRTLGLTYDTFIHLGDIKSIPEFAIRRAAGTCSFMQRIEEYCKENNIAI